MNTFSEFLNFSKEDKKLSGTRSSISSDHTAFHPLHTGDGQRKTGNENFKRMNIPLEENGIGFPKTNNAFKKTVCATETQQMDSNSWAACEETLQSLLDQYVKDSRSLSSLKQMLLASNILQKKDNDREKTQATSQAPPPLLHRPAKRFLEQSQPQDTTLAKYPRRESVGNYFKENQARLLSKDKGNFQAEIFEKTRSLGASSKQLRSPPPLLKQDETSRNEPETLRNSPQYHYGFTNEVYEPSTDLSVSGVKTGYTKSASHLANTKRITRICEQDSERTEEMNAKRSLSHLSPDGKQEPLPREILDGDCKTSCGGFAFDHTAMPKIVAVHSISKNAEDMDEWERNRAFISKVKAQQNRDKATEERGQQIPQRTPLETKSIPKKSQKGSVQGASNFKEAINSNVANETDATPGEISFERYVLYHLLSKFQGDVERVRNILKQNLLQEWLSHCQGNVDPKLQTFNGVNFYELRKLYEIWCQLQRNSKTNQPQGSENKASFSAQNLEPKRIQMRSDFSFSKNTPNVLGSSQRSQTSQLFQAAHLRSNQRNYSQKSVSNWKGNVPETPAKLSRSPSNFQERILSGVAEGIMTKNQQTGHSLEQPSSQQIVPLSRSLNHVSSFKALRPDMSQEQSVIKHVSSDQNLSHDKAFYPSQEQVVRNHYEASERMRGQSKIVFREQERADGTNISSVTLLHISQTNSKAPSFDTARRENVSSSFKGRCGLSHHNEKQANQFESPCRNTVRSQETRGNYLWRFKGGKLISDSMPCINDAEVIPEVNIEKFFSDQLRIMAGDNQSWQKSLEANKELLTTGQISHNKVSAATPRLLHDQSCSIGISQSHEIQTLYQQHKKVCGAAATGKPCFCVLRSAQAENTPIECLQQLLKRAEESSSDPSRNESSYDKVPNCGSIYATSAVQEKQQSHLHLKSTRNADGNDDIQAQPTHSYASLGISPNQNVHAELNVVSHTHEFSPSYTGPSHSSNAQANQQIHAIRSESQAQTRENSNVGRDELIISQSYNSQKTYGNAQANRTSHSNINTREKLFHARFGISNKTLDTKPLRLHYSSSEEPNQQSTPCLNILRTEQGTKQLTSELAARDSQVCSVNPEIRRIAQPNHRASVVLRSTCNTSADQHSKRDAHVLQKLERDHQSNTNMNGLLSAKSNKQSCANVSISPNLQQNVRSSPSFNVERKAQTGKQSSLDFKTLLSANPNKQSKSGFNIPNIQHSSTQRNRQSESSFCIQRETQQANQSSNANLKTLVSTQPNQKSTPSFHLSRTGRSFQQPSFSVESNSQANHQSIASLQILALAQKSEKCNATLHISQPSTTTVVTIAPKFDKVPLQKSEPTLSRNSSYQNASLANAKNPVVIKSERVKDQKGRSPVPLAPKKSYASLHQLVKKIIETRERYEMENIPWKKKILKSLEGVLIKRLRKIEKDTGEKADLGDGEKLATETNISNKK